MIQPLNEMVLIEPLEAPDMSPGGIHLPGSARRSQEGLVRASGWDQVSEGGKVIYSQNGAAQIEENGEQFLLVPKLQILAVIR